MADEDDLTEEVEFDDEEEAVEPDELDDDELAGDEDDFLEPEDDIEALDTEEEAEEADTVVRRPTSSEDEDEDEDLVTADDVEADLDTILKERLVAADDEGDDEEEELEVDDRGEPVDRIQPKRPGEFVCQSCFLVKHPSQLADADRQLCTDCV